MARPTRREWFSEFAKTASSRVGNGRGNRFIVLDNVVIETKEIVVHRFVISDVDDPDLFAGEPLWEWQNSERGQWVMERSIETPVWTRVMEPVYYRYQYVITARFDTKTLTEYYLRFGNTAKTP